MAPYDAERGAPIPDDAAPCVKEIAALPGFKFIAVFDWTLRKGADPLVKAFEAEFADRDDVHLILKVWSSMGYSNEQLHSKVGEYLQESLESAQPGNVSARIHWIHERISDRDMRALYRATDCTVSASRCEVGIRRVQFVQ